MSDFQTFIADRKSEVDNLNTRTENYLRQATVRALKEVSSIRCLLNEASFSFTTTINQQQYTAGYPGFALDISKILLIYYPNQPGSATNLSARRIVEKSTLEEVRRNSIWQTLGIPYRYCWHADSLILGPVPNSAMVLNVDYQRDATRDTLTGNPITTTSTTATNPWFVRGEHILRAIVLRDYHMSISNDAGKAQAMGVLASEGMATLRKDFAARGTSSAQAPDYFDDRQNDLIRSAW